MNHILKPKVFVSTALLLLASVAATAQDNVVLPLDSIADTPYNISVENRADSTVISFDLDVPAKFINRREAYIVTPQAVNGSWSMPLPALSVEGKYYARVTDGKILFKQKKDFERIDVCQRVLYTGKQQSVHYRASIPATPRMQGASVTLTEKIVSPCVDCMAQQAVRETSYKTEEVKQPEEQPAASQPLSVYVSTLPVMEKRTYVEDFGGESIFKVGETKVVDSIFKAGYRKLCEKIITTVDEDFGNIDHVTVRVASSPDGRESNNRRLAQGRANTLRQYVLEGLKIDENMLSMDVASENWDGFIEAVKASDWADKDTILSIIARNADYDKREAMLTKLPDYRNRIIPVFQNLRNCLIVVDYTAFTDTVRMEKHFGYEPRQLGSKPVVDLDKALNAFREKANDRNANNLAVAYMERGDYEKAQEYLACISAEGRSRKEIAANEAVLRMLMENRPR